MRKNMSTWHKKSVWAKQKRASRKTYTLAERTRFELVEP